MPDKVSCCYNTTYWLVVDSYSMSEVQFGPLNHDDMTPDPLLVN